MSKWYLTPAVRLCTQLEPIAAIFGGHVALTGGCLYKNGDRKDVDIMIYRSTDEPPFRWDDFFAEVKITHGIELVHDYGFCKKATIGARVLFEDAEPGEKLRIDFFDPFGVYEHGTSGDIPTLD